MENTKVSGHKCWTEMGRGYSTIKDSLVCQGGVLNDTWGITN